MAITGINNSSYTSYYASNYKNTIKKTDSEKDSTNTKDGNVTTSTVELKTSRPGVTKTEQIKTGYSNVNDYSKYLQGKYHYMNTGTTSMQGVPTTVSVSSAFLQKCMNDPEKAKYLEENLAAIPDCAKSAVNGCLGTLTTIAKMAGVEENDIDRLLVNPPEKVEIEVKYKIDVTVMEGVSQTILKKVILVLLKISRMIKSKCTFRFSGCS